MWIKWNFSQIISIHSINISDMAGEFISFFDNEWKRDEYMVSKRKPFHPLLICSKNCSWIPNIVPKLWYVFLICNILWQFRYWKWKRSLSHSSIITCLLLNPIFLHISIHTVSGSRNDQQSLKCYIFGQNTDVSIQVPKGFEADACKTLANFSFRSSDVR